MPMHPTRDFWQHGVESKVSSSPEGVCFRESFKWLACKIRGLEFKFEDSNAQKVLDKQQAYLRAIKPYEGAKASFDTFFTNVHRHSQKKLDEWGSKESSKTKTSKCRLRFTSQVVLFTLSGCQAFNRDAQMIIGLYGKTDKAGPWAHAVAFYRRGNEIVYFDANGGEFGFDPADQIGAELMKDFRYRDQPYVGLDGGVKYTLERFGLYTAIEY